MVCIFRPIATAHCHRQTRYIPPHLQAALCHRGGYDVREQRVACDNNVGARDDAAHKRNAKTFEKLVQFLAVFGVKDRKPRKRGAFLPMEEWGKRPEAAMPMARLGLLFLPLLETPEWRSVKVEWG